MMRHHACLVRLYPVSAEAALVQYQDTAAAEVYPLVFKVIGINEVRDIIYQASLRPSNGQFRLLVVCTEAITFEAQQALLKVIEEPPASTRFLFAVPEQLVLLPTLASRFSEINQRHEVPLDKSVMPDSFSAFAAQSAALRLSEVSKRLTKKDVAWVAEIKQGLLVYLTDTKIKPVELLTRLQFVLEHLETRGASNKLLLEELSLSLPPSAQK